MAQGRGTTANGGAYDGVMSAKTQFYLQLATSVLFALAAVMSAVRREWWAAGLFGAAAVVSLIVAAPSSPTAHPQLNRDRPLCNGGRNRKDAAALSMLHRRFPRNMRRNL
jgi:hypothetical protein